MTDYEFTDFAEQVEAHVQPEKPKPISGEKILEIATGLLNKIDTEGKGFIDITMLHAYCKRILDFVKPGAAVDIVSLEYGFKKLDKDGDGKVLLFDLMQFVAA